MNRILKIISILCFYVKKKIHYISRRWKRIFFLNYLRQRQIPFVAMRYSAAAFFAFILAWKTVRYVGIKMSGDVVQKPPRRLL